MPLVPHLYLSYAPIFNILSGKKNAELKNKLLKSQCLNNWKSLTQLFPPCFFAGGWYESRGQIHQCKLIKGLTLPTRCYVDVTW